MKRKTNRRKVFEVYSLFICGNENSCFEIWEDEQLHVNEEQKFYVEILLLFEGKGLNNNFKEIKTSLVLKFITCIL